MTSFAIIGFALSVLLELLFMSAKDSTASNSYHKKNYCMILAGASKVHLGRLGPIGLVAFRAGVDSYRYCISARPASTFKRASSNRHARETPGIGPIRH